MQIEKIVIQGFKSFYFRTEIGIFQGITTIVGPNGAGKSNIADAIAWVMGEQSSKALRSNEMLQVISQGSKSLKPLGMAEVSLIFKENNDNRTIITRKLFRNGESIYMINGEESRLKDILDILSGFHLAPRSYTIIEQNKIQSLIDSKPYERRIFFDDAAGITRYKAKKKETINKLLATENNLQRINDIISEVSQNRKSLKRQATKAITYQKLLNNLNEYKNNLFSIKYSLIKKEIYKLDEEINSIIKNKNSLIKKINISNADIENNKQLIIQKEDTLMDYTKKLNTIDTKIKDIEKLIAVNQTNIMNSNNDIKAKENLLSNYKDKNQKLSNILIELQNKIASLEKNSKEIVLSSKKSSILYNYLNSIINIINNKLEIEKQAYYKINSEYETNINIKSNLMNHINELESKAAETNEFLSNAKYNFETLNKTYKKLNNLLNQIKDYSLLIENFKKKAEDVLFNINDKINECNLNETFLNTEIAKIDSACFQIEKFLNEQFAFRIIQNYKIEINKLAISFKGFLIDYIEIPTKYIKLINFIYRDTLYSAIVDNEEDMKILDSFLKEKNVVYSIICLDKINLIKDRFDKHSEKAIQLSKIIPVSENFNNLSCIFYNTYIFDDISLFQYIKEYENTYYYFEKQDCVYFNGTFYFLGNLEDKSNALIYENELRMLKKDKESYHNKLINVIEKKKFHEISKNEIVNILTKIEQEYKNMLSIKKNIEGLLNKINFLRKQFELKIELINSEQDKILKELTNRMVELNTIDNKLKEDKENLLKKKHIVNTLANYEEIYLKLRIDSKTIVDKLKYADIKIESSLNALKIEKEKAKREKEEIYNYELKLIYEIKEIKKNIEKSYDDQNKYNEQIKEFVEEKKFLSDLYTKINLEKNELKAKVSALDTLVKKFIQDKEIIINKLNQLEMKRMQLEMECNHLEENCLNETKRKIMYIENTLEEDIEKLKAEIFKIENKINLLGQINSLAIQEYEEVNKKYEFLSEQREDITKSCQSLKKAIEKLDLYMKKKIEITLENVNNYLNEYFQLIFKGGSIEIYFEDSNNILDSPIEFKIRLPNKKISTIQLLSGGEKSLIGLLFLFSIFRYRPSFFCVWDEIDAALDDANIINVVNIINQLKNQVQFILITHNKLMMEAADQLYGITMEEEGVSKIYSVKISDLKENNIVAV